MIREVYLFGQLQVGGAQNNAHVSSVHPERHRPGTRSAPSLEIVCTMSKIPTKALRACTRETLSLIKG